LTDRALSIASSGDRAVHFVTRRADLLLIVGDRPALERLLETAVVPAPDSWRAVAEAEAGDIPRALKLLERSRADGRRSFEYWLNAAFVNTLADRPAEVARSYRLAAMLATVTPPPARLPQPLSVIGHDPNDFWMYGRSTSRLSWDAGLSLPSPGRGAWLRLRDPGSIEVPALRELRFEAASRTGAASGRP
jgi:hypothetical protein